MKRLVGLAGVAGAGKDTVASILIKDFGYTKVSFASPLYEALYRLDPIIWGEQSDNLEIRLQELVDVNGWEYTKRTYPGVRALLQRMGTEVGRELFGDDFWINLALAEAEKYDKVVITDVRFPNEYWSLRLAGHDVYRVIRPGTGPVNGHVSDNALGDDDNYTARILNDGTVSDLYRQTLSVIQP